jgi:hypothetical protein
VGQNKSSSWASFSTPQQLSPTPNSAYAVYSSALTFDKTFSQSSVF